MKEFKKINIPKYYYNFFKALEVFVYNSLLYFFDFITKNKNIMKKTLIITSLTIPTALGVFGYYYYNGFQAGKGNVQKDLKFHVNVDYCLGCGFRQSAELFSKNVFLLN